MPAFPSAIAQVRGAVCAIMRISEAVPPKDAKRNKKKPGWRVGFCGTGWCFSERRYIATAHHIFNGGKPRDPADKFFVFIVPTNGPMAYHTAVVGFPFEDASIDMAVLEIAPAPGFDLPAVPVTFTARADGEHVLTYGYPAPTVASGQLDPSGNWITGNLLLKGHANEGIVSAAYDWDNQPAYELNVGWHHGESGGPAIALEPLAVFAVMQFYRNIQSPHGVVAGPHMGRAVKAMEGTLRTLGAQVV